MCRRKHTFDSFNRLGSVIDNTDPFARRACWRPSLLNELGVSSHDNIENTPLTSWADPLQPIGELGVCIEQPRSILDRRHAYIPTMSVNPPVGKRLGHGQGLSHTWPARH